MVEHISHQIQSQNAKMSELSRTLDAQKDHNRELTLEIARRDGYIDRVREMDGQNRVARKRLVQALWPRQQAADITAEDILGMSDDDFGKLIDNSPTALDRALGKDELEDDDD